MMQNLTVIHSNKFPIDRYREALDREKVAYTTVTAGQAHSKQNGRLSVVLLDDVLAGGNYSVTTDPAVTMLGVGLAAREDADDRIYLHLPEDPSATMLVGALRRAYEFLQERVRNNDLEQALRERTQELEEINKIGIAMSTVRDHEVLLSTILSKSRELSRSDAGSLYLVEEEEDGTKFLRWKLAQNDSIKVNFEEKILPMTKKSLAGHVAMTGETLVIDDAYELANVEYTINRSFDVATGYLTKSMLVFPMLTHTGDIIGVLQLINRKKWNAPSRLTAATVPDAVIPFDPHTIKLMQSLAGQAAVSLENNVLYDSIERLFEGFVTASVTAIEQRDPTTSGHSFRVANLTCELAKTVDGIDEGIFAPHKFTVEQLREIRYASLLHDFGKVGVREKVLVKEKKLYPLQIDIIRSRFDYLVKAVEAKFEKMKLEHALKHGLDDFVVWSAKIDEERDAEIARLRHDLQFIVHSNEPTVLPEGDFAYLQELGKRQYEDAAGEIRALVTDDEVRTLSIRKGNLDPQERGEIESHVTHTFRFLSKIPWTRDLRDVPHIAYAHHEKLNGRGYPRGLGAEGIPIQSKMMSITDIYDALTANDRPYKKAVPTERALDILKMEVKDGLLDGKLLDVFLEAKVYERTGAVRL
jgi:HD-GYP domain-containing protein (c-di-GMP phosphodiesterase class II)